MKVKLVKSLHHIPYDPKDEKSGKSWVMNDLLSMENKFGMVEIDFRPYICYAPLDILQKCIKYLSKLERQGYITIDRNWENVELEHPFVAKRVRDLMWHGDLKNEALGKIPPYERTTPYQSGVYPDVGGYWE